MLHSSIKKQKSSKKFFFLSSLLSERTLFLSSSVLLIYGTIWFSTDTIESIKFPCYFQATQEIILHAPEQGTLSWISWNSPSMHTPKEIEVFPGALVAIIDPVKEDLFASADQHSTSSTSSSISLHAPFRGLLCHYNQEIFPGQVIYKGTPLAKIINFDQVKLVVYLSEKYQNQIITGKKVEFSPAGHTEKLTAHIQEFIPSTPKDLPSHVVLEIQLDSSKDEKEFSLNNWPYPNPVFSEIAGLVTLNFHKTSFAQRLFDWMVALVEE